MCVRGEEGCPTVGGGAEPKSRCVPLSCPRGLSKVEGGRSRARVLQAASGPCYFRCTWSLWFIPLSARRLFQVHLVGFDGFDSGSELHYYKERRMQLQVKTAGEQSEAVRGGGSKRRGTAMGVCVPCGEGEAAGCAKRERRGAKHPALPLRPCRSTPQALCYTTGGGSKSAFDG
jgi:hypothetical protein